MERRFEISTEHDKIQSELSIIGAEIEAVNENDALSEQEKSELYEESLIKKCSRYWIKWTEILMIPNKARKPFPPVTGIAKKLPLFYNPLAQR